MVKHIVFFKVKKTHNDNEKINLAKQIAEILKPLPKKIPQIKEYEIGINISDRDTAFDVVLISIFENEEGLNIYRFHPEHQKAVEKIKELTQEAAVVDYNQIEFFYSKK